MELSLQYQKLVQSLLLEVFGLDELVGSLRTSDELLLMAEVWVAAVGD